MICIWFAAVNWNTSAGSFCFKKKHLTQNNSFAPGATSGPRTNHISTASCLPISVIHEKRFCLSSVKQKINWLKALKLHSSLQCLFEILQKWIFKELFLRKIATSVVSGCFFLCCCLLSAWHLVYYYENQHWTKNNLKERRDCCFCYIQCFQFSDTASFSDRVNEAFVCQILAAWTDSVFI